MASLQIQSQRSNYQIKPCLRNDLKKTFNLQFRSSEVLLLPRISGGERERTGSSMLPRHSQKVLLLLLQLLLKAEYLVGAGGGPRLGPGSPQL